MKNFLIILGVALLAIALDRSGYHNSLVWLIGSAIVTVVGLNLKTPFIARFGFVLLGVLLTLMMPIWLLKRDHLTELDRFYLPFWLTFVAIWIACATVGRTTGKRLVYSLWLDAYTSLKPGEQEEVRDFFAVRWAELGNGKIVVISWRMAEAFPPLRWLLPNRKDCRLLGYRSEQQFDPEKLVEGGFLTLPKQERVWIADGTKDIGCCEDELEAGKRYFYVFFVKTIVKGKEQNFDWITFSVKLPKSNNAARPVQSPPERRKTEEERKGEQFEQWLENLKLETKLDVRLDGAEEEAVEELKQTDIYKKATPEARERMEARVRGRFEMARLQRE